MAADAARQRVASTEADVETAKAQLAQAEPARKELAVLQWQAASLVQEQQQWRFLLATGWAGSNPGVEGAC